MSGTIRTYEDINTRIRNGDAVVVTAEELVGLVATRGVHDVAQDVDAVTTATFSPMCSSGVLLNFGHSDPPIRMQEIRLNRCERKKTTDWINIQESLYETGLRSTSLILNQQFGCTLLQEAQYILITFFAASSVISGGR